MNRSASATGLLLTKPPPRWVFFAIFTISGFSGLIYESIWSHYLKLFLGHAAYAQSLVLTIFMGGLALGSWVAARCSPSWRFPILIYAVVEGVIGLVALVFHPVFVGVTDSFYFSILPAVNNALIGSTMKWTAAALLILPQSVLLGMTFPLMSAGIIRRYADHPGASLAMLYFTNSIGAAVGVLASGFWLIRLVGLPGTIFTAGLLNIALALTVWMLVKLDPDPAPEPIRPGPSSEKAAPDELATLFFVAAGVTGAASFIYEIGWIRMLSLVLGSTTHSFELMLSAFITGLAFGGLWIKRRIDGIGNVVRFCGWVQVLMGAVAISTVPIYVSTFDWMATMLAALESSDEGYVLFTLLSHGIALLVMVPTTFLAGMTLPLFTHALMRGRQGEQAIGRVYAANTLGAISGVLFAVHVGMPLLGLKSLIGLGAALDVVLGVVFLHRSRTPGEVTARLNPALPGIVVGTAALLAVLLGVDLDPKRLASGVYRYRSAKLDDQTTAVYYRDGKTATITLMAQGGQLTIATNGKPDASIQMDPQQPRALDEITMIMLAALPLAYNSQARQVANIGFGAGLTTHTLLADSDIQRVDTVEIEPVMVEAAHGFGERVVRAFSDPRSRIYIEDAKTFFSLGNRAYDVIVAEPSNPWVSGVASLFSEEFYRSLRNYLAADGIFVQWLQLYEFNDALVLSVLRALSRNFSDYVVYNTDDTNILIVAKRDGRLDQPAFDRVLRGGLRPDLERVGLRNAGDFLARKTGSKTEIEGLLAHDQTPANSDFFPFVDLNAGRARFRGETGGLFFAWSISALPILEMLGVSEVGFASVSADQTFQRTSLIAGARSALAEVRDQTASRESWPATRALTTLQLLLRSCEPIHFEKEWRSALHSLAMLSLPFLNAPSGNDLLTAVTPENCSEPVPERLRSWLDLYRAIAARDARAMAATAENLLSHDHAADSDRRRYLLAAAMLGQLAQDQPGKAMELWGRYTDGDENAEIAPDFRLLVSSALNRQRGSTANVP